MANPRLVKVRVIAFGTEVEVLMHPNEELHWLLERALTLSGRHRDDDAEWRRRWGRGWEVVDGTGRQLRLNEQFWRLRDPAQGGYQEPIYVNEPVGVDG